MGALPSGESLAVVTQPTTALPASANVEDEAISYLPCGFGKLHNPLAHSITLR
jgi:hypothetical protein